MKQFLLEDTIPLLLVVVFTGVALGIVWHRFRTPRTLYVWVGATVIGILLLVVQKMVVTDREAIEQAVRRLAFAVESADIDTIAAAIDAAYDADALDKRELMPLIEATLKQVDVSGVRLDRFKVDVEGDTGTASFRAFCRVRGRGIEQPVLGRWALELVRRPEGWGVTAIVPRELNHRKVRGLRDAVGLRN